jgi:O-antigen/teichoic acid export membrane protein
VTQLVEETVATAPREEWRARLRRSELAEVFLLPQQPLWRRAARGATWMFGLRIFEKLLALIRTLILVRFLVPRDFGLFAIVLMAVSALDLLNMNGLRAALIQRPEESRRDLDTVWSVLLLQNCANAGLLILAAEPIARFFGAPPLAGLIRAFSIVLLLEALVSIGTIHFEKRMLFHKQFAFVVSGAVVDFIVAVSVAATFHSVWALVAGAIVGRAARLLASYMLQEFRPRFRIKWQNLRQLVPLSGWMRLSTVFWFLLLQGDNLFIGRMLGIGALGIYTIAFSIASVTRTDIGTVLQRLMFPSFASIQHDEVELRRGYLKLLRGTALFVVPISVGLAVLAPGMVTVLLGARWALTAPIIAILALLGALHVFLGNANALLRGIGRSGQALASEAIFVAVAAALMFPLASKLHLTGVALAMLLGAAAGWAWAEGCVLRAVKSSLHQLLQSFESSIAAAVVMVATLYLLRGLFPRPGWGPLLAMILGSCLMYAFTVLAAALSRKRVLKADAAAG